jgi:hypothetical protein
MRLIVSFATILASLRHSFTGSVALISSGSGVGNLGLAGRGFSIVKSYRSQRGPQRFVRWIQAKRKAYPAVAKRGVKILVPDRPGYEPKWYLKRRPLAGNIYAFFRSKRKKPNEHLSPFAEAT